jgi:hypothetical protein
LGGTIALNFNGHRINGTHTITDGAGLQNFFDIGGKGVLLADIDDINTAYKKFYSIVAHTERTIELDFNGHKINDNISILSGTGSDWKTELGNEALTVTFTNSSPTEGGIYSVGSNDNTYAGLHLQTKSAGVTVNLENIHISGYWFGIVMFNGEIGDNALRPASQGELNIDNCDITGEVDGVGIAHYGNHITNISNSTISGINAIAQRRGVINITNCDLIVLDGDMYAPEDGNPTHNIGTLWATGSGIYIDNLANSTVELNIDADTTITTLYGKPEIEYYKWVWGANLDAHTFTYNGTPVVTATDSLTVPTE